MARRGAHRAGRDKARTGASTRLVWLREAIVMVRRLAISLVLALLIGAAALGGAARAGSCGAAVEAAKVEWRSLTRGNHTVSPAMRINTSDGRQLTGTQLNFAWVLIDRAESACNVGQDAAAMGHIDEFEKLLHPVPRRL
jgi:hypothetical protein